MPSLVTPFAVFLLRQFFLSLPRELEEAAWIDGCSRLRVLFTIVLPLSRPALGTVAVLTFLTTWNDLTWPLIAINHDTQYTLQLGLTTFQGQHHTKWSAVMAGNVITVLPVLLAFLFAQKSFIRRSPPRGSRAEPARGRPPRVPPRPDLPSPTSVPRIPRPADSRPDSTNTAPGDRAHPHSGEPMPHTFDLLVVGDANPDVIVGPLTEPLAFGQREQLVDSGALTLGGSAAIMACGAARLGLKVAFAGRVGDDDAGRFVATRSDSAGVDTEALRLDPGLPTPLTVVVTRRGTTTARSSRPRAPFPPPPGRRRAAGGCWPPTPACARGLLLPAAPLAAALPELLARRPARTAPRHRWTPATTPPGAGSRAARPRSLAETDFLLPNAREAVARHTPRLPRTLRSAGPGRRRCWPPHRGTGTHVVVKNGADGALCHDGRALLPPGASPSPTADTVGAGDSFDAGFLAATLHGMPLREALEFAAVCGALSTRAAGGTPAQPTWDEAIDQLPPAGQNSCHDPAP